MVNALFREIKTLLSGLCDDADSETKVIFETVLGRDWKLLELKNGFLNISPESEKMIRSLSERRLTGEPLQYIVGEWEFYGMRIKVGDGVLIPRQDTETLVETALGLIKNTNKPRVLDLCSGTGCVALAIAKNRPDSEVAALELYPEAYKILCENAKEHGGIKTVCADALDQKTAQSFSDLDLITANPPYLTESDMNSLQREVGFEPKTALFGGKDGLDFYRSLPKIWIDSIKEGGHIALEIGLGQQESVASQLKAAGFKNICSARDLTGRIRVLHAEK